MNVLKFAPNIHWHLSHITPVHPLWFYGTNFMENLRSWQHDYYIIYVTWWRIQMETFSGLLAICVGNSSVNGEFPLQRPVTRSFDVFFDPRLNKRLNKQLWGWWFETPSCYLCVAVVYGNKHRRCIQICSYLSKRVLYSYSFTKRTNVFPQDLVKSRSRKIRV